MPVPSWPSSPISTAGCVPSRCAGEFGRGFNVVAQEIKSLAATTGEAAENIKNLTRDLQSTLEQAKQD